MGSPSSSAVFEEILVPTGISSFLPPQLKLLRGKRNPESHPPVVLELPDPVVVDLPIKVSDTGGPLYPAGCWAVVGPQISLDWEVWRRSKRIQEEQRRPCKVQVVVVVP